MSEFFIANLSYPTVIFTILLGVSVVYWTLVIIGALGMDVLDVDADADGVAEGAGEAPGDGAEGSADSAGAFSTLLHVLKLKRAPLTLVLSLVFFWAWFLSHLSAIYLAGALDFMPGWISGTLVGGACLVLAFVFTSVCLRPFGSVFAQEPQVRRTDLVGKIVKLATSRVDGEFGTATADDGGAGLIVQIRCDADNALTRGDKALVVAWDDAREAFEVTPVDDFLPSEALAKK